MPHQHSVLEIRISNIVACLEPAIGLLNDLHDVCGTPFVQAISNTTLSLITMVQNVKKNKDDCVQLMENIHNVIYAIVDLHIKSETPGSLPPATLDHIGKFMQTIHKIHAYVEEQQGGNKIKQFFRQNEMSTLLKDCYTGVQHAQEVFKIASGATILASLKEAQITAENMHKELLELISTVSDGTASDSASSMYRTSQVSSKSLSMLPGKPKIFRGRDHELNQILQILSQKSARIAILGPGGMGKTSLAKAALHHTVVTTNYEHRFFVPCDSATTSIELAAIIGAHIGLKPGNDLTKPVIRNFSAKETCLLILDNLETTWEPLTSRHGVEELLALLADINHLALMITMRGAERPAKVQWTHPFLPPLGPLSAEAAREMFIDIADDIHDPKEIDPLLHLTDHMPLAVDLIAHLVDAEGCSNVLTRWETEKTSMLSAGHDHRSNLDASIAISLSSPRLTSVAGAKDLLSLLSILPDGVSDVELLQSNLLIPNIRACKVALLQTSLAFSDDHKRLKSLVPIREYMQYLHPPALSLVQPLQKYFHALLDLVRKYSGSHQELNTINQITQNLGNVHQVLLQGLHSQNTDLVDTIKCTISFANFHNQMTANGQSTLMEKIFNLLPKLCDHRLEVQFVTQVLNSPFAHKSTFNLDALVAQTLSHFQSLNDPILEFLMDSIAMFYEAVAFYHGGVNNDKQKSIQFAEKALALAKSTGATELQAKILKNYADMKEVLGEFVTGRTLSIEAQRLAKLATNLHLEASAMRIEVICCMFLGMYRYSLYLVHKGRDLLRCCGMSGSYYDHRLISLEAEVHQLKSEYAEAKRIHLEITQSTSADSDIFNNAYAFLNISQIDVLIGGEKNEVCHNLGKVETVYSNVGIVLGLRYCELIRAELHLREGDTVIAKPLFQKCMQGSWTTSSEILCYCLEKMSDVNQWSPMDFHWSSMCTVTYVAVANKSHNKLALHKALQHLGDVFLHNGDTSTAESLFVVALEGFTYMDVHRSRADCMLRLGDLAQQQGNMPRAEELWRQARPLFERSLQAKDVEKIDSRLVVANEQKLGYLGTLHVPELPEASPIGIDTVQLNSENQETEPLHVTMVAILSSVIKGHTSEDEHTPSRLDDEDADREERGQKGGGRLTVHAPAWNTHTRNSSREGADIESGTAPTADALALDTIVTRVHALHMFAPTEASSRTQTCWRGVLRCRREGPCGECIFNPSPNSSKRTLHENPTSPFDDSDPYTNQPDPLPVHQQRAVARAAAGSPPPAPADAGAGELVHAPGAGAAKVPGLCAAGPGRGTPAADAAVAGVLAGGSGIGGGGGGGAVESCGGEGDTVPWYLYPGDIQLESA
ncbi:hypothetical protein B0H11DRAFT_2306239 [Mycena galericulata]|nr:hypothetical protein B0H11DRAFT_2306239 [Mycena galericulata]